MLTMFYPLRHAALALSVLLALSLNVQASEPERGKLIWLTNHWPPHMILKGEDVDRGRFDRLWHIWTQHMPQYQHQRLEMNWGRFWEDVKNGKHVCNPIALKTPERETFAYFSDPLSVGLSNRIIMRKTDIQRLGNPTSYSLATLLSDKRFQGLIENQRSYTSELDALIAKAPEHSNIRKDAVQAEQLIQMLLHGRVSYIIEYPSVTGYLLPKYTETPGQIGSIPISEIAPNALGYLACPKNQWGMQVIRDFNAMLETVKRKPEYLETVTLWHSPDDQAAIRAAFSELILNPKSNPNLVR